MVAEFLEQASIFIDTLSATCRLPGNEYSEVYGNKWEGFKEVKN